MLIFSLEDHIPAEEERVVMEKIQVKRQLEALDMQNVISKMKETNRISRYNQDMRGQPVIIMFNMEFCSQEVRKWAKKLADKEEFGGVFIRGNRPREE